MLNYAFTCPLPNGVHARPASELEETSRRFASAISITNGRTGRTANAKSVLAIVGLDIRLKDPCVVAISGVDERDAFAALQRFLEVDFPHTDDAVPPIEAPPGVVRLPPLLKNADAAVLPGTPVVAGIGSGRGLVVGRFELPAGIPRDGVTDGSAEIARLDAAIERSIQALDGRLRRASGVEATILKAHRSIARDPEFRQHLHEAIRERRATSAGAIAHAEAQFTSMLLSSTSALLRERALDIRDVCGELLKEVYGEEGGKAAVRLTVDSVCIAETLTPGQFLALDRRLLKGLVLTHGGTTSHTVILARSFGIPTLVGVGGPEAARLDGEEVIVDGDLGVLVTHVTAGVRRYYEMEGRRLQGRQARLRRFVTAAAATADGRRIEVGANIGTAEEAPPAFAAGAEGIGLFRTEMLFVDRDAPPAEEEQFEQYRAVLAEADGRPVIIRTLDVGGDKPIPYLRLPKEDNPFLGYRAVRLYPEFDAIFRSQIAALVRASTFGRLKVMVPMVSQPEEARRVRAIVAEEQAKCAQAGVAFDKEMPVGAMMEVPSLAFALDAACRDLDFLSIGTNDLLQYFTAVDRANPKVASLYNPMQPAFLRFLKKIVDDAHAAARWVGLCGEMGGQLRCLPLLVGLGLDEISMVSPAIAEAKAALASLPASDCAALLSQAVACDSAADVERLVAGFEAARPAPITEPDLVIIGSEARSKEEAVKEIADRLYAAGRTDRPREVEEAVWGREAHGSTAFGNAFAIPHGESDAVRANSVAFLTLRQPIEWPGALDEKPVSVLLLLAVREADKSSEHMRIFSALARRLVHEDFRERLLHEQDPAAICAFLRDTIGA